MKYLITIFLFFSMFACEMASSQIIMKEIMDLTTKVRILKRLTSRQQNSYSNIEGTPYLFEDFKPGEIYTIDNILYKGPLRYDIYADEIEFKANDIVYCIAEPQKIVYVKIEKSTFIYIHPDEKENIKGSFYELLVEGEVQLLLKRNTAFLKAEAAKPYTDPKPNRLERMNDIYFLLIDKGLPQLITSKKSIINALSEKNSDISRYIKKQKISTREKGDLIKLVMYYNSL